MRTGIPKSILAHWSELLSLKYYSVMAIRVYICTMYVHQNMTLCMYKHLHNVLVHVVYKDLYICSGRQFLCI